MRRCLSDKYLVWALVLLCVVLSWMTRRKRRFWGGSSPGSSGGSDRQGLIRAREDFVPFGRVVSSGSPGVV